MSLNKTKPISGQWEIGRTKLTGKPGPRQKRLSRGEQKNLDDAQKTANQIEIQAVAKAENQAVSVYRTADRTLAAAEEKQAEARKLEAAAKEKKAELDKREQTMNEGLNTNLRKWKYYRKKKKLVNSVILQETALVLAPDLYISELANTLRKYYRPTIFTKDECMRYINNGINFIDTFVDNGELWKEAFSEGINNECSMYDMLDMVAARGNDGTFLTNDSVLISICKKNNILIKNIYPSHIVFFGAYKGVNNFNLTLIVVFPSFHPLFTTVYSEAAVIAFKIENGACCVFRDLVYINNEFDPFLMLLCGEH